MTTFPPSLPLAIFDVGGQELIVIFLAILIFLGPKKLPELARALARARNEFNKATREFNEQIEKAANAPEPVEPKKLDHSPDPVPQQSSENQSKTR